MENFKNPLTKIETHKYQVSKCFLSKILVWQKRHAACFEVISKYPLYVICLEMQHLQNTIKVGQPESTKNLVESNPLNEATKLSTKSNLGNSVSWQEIRGLTWIFDVDGIS